MLVPFISNKHKGTQEHVTVGGQVLLCDLLEQESRSAGQLANPAH